MLDFKRWQLFIPRKRTVEDTHKIFHWELRDHVIYYTYNDPCDCEMNRNHWAECSD